MASSFTSTTSKPNLRSSSSFPNLLLSCLNLTLFVLAAASVGPTILLRVPPTSAGVALLAVSATSLLSASVGFCSHLTHLCFVSHASLLAAALAGQLLAALALFAREAAALSALGSRRDPREARLLVRAECGVMTAMVLLQAAALAMSCAVQGCWVRDHERMEAERDAAAARRRGGGRRVAADAEVKTETEVKGKYGHVQWVKTDFEG